ncbi:hypothetical protein E3N88_14576 [Mikania micrantha]|uniref:Uncharacterized protein n=1 Tax=Mikania micrantha TaxID=192012 RepID=A0A5N6P4F3_9ASTR|nr:hypothetical protein E3N88_14576 [Mikania micrantha]
MWDNQTMESEFDPILSWAHFFLLLDSSVFVKGAPSRNEDFLNAIEVQVAGGEDRVQAVCSEAFFAIYDGFNETIRVNLNSLDIELDYFINDGNTTRVLDSLQRALNQAVIVGQFLQQMMTDKIKIDEFKGLKAVQLSDTHTITVDNEVERTQILSEHPKTIVHGKVKGKLKVSYLTKQWTPFNLTLLPDESLSLIAQHASDKQNFNDVNRKLKSYGGDIINKCGRLPMALRILGSRDEA